MRPFIADRCATADKSMTSCTLPLASIATPVCLHEYTSEWSPNIDSACVATVLAATWNTPGSSSPAILYIFGNIKRSPCEAVKVVARTPALNAPWSVAAAPASDCSSTTLTSSPKRFFLPAAAHSSTSSAIGDEGVIGYIGATWVNA